MAWTDEEIAHSRVLLGVPETATTDVVNKAYVQKSYALIRAGGSEEDKEQLKLARDALLEVLHTAEQQQLAAARTAATERREEYAVAKLVAAAEKEEEAAKEKDPGRWHPASFDSAGVNAIYAPLVAGLGVVLGAGPLSGLLAGFFVWIHEFGHATAAWMTGRRALPLPIGWTPIGPERSTFVYFGVLFLLAVFFVAGAKEKKIVPMLLAVGLALAQYVMTWRWPEQIGYKWSIFAGVGGEFYLSALMMGLFYFRLPQKFRWGGCRYFFLFIGGAGFYRIWTFWQQVKHGTEGIPYGSMVGGEEDEGGDMNILHGDFDWSQHDIVRTYDRLGTACLLTLTAIYLVFALRVDRFPRRWLERAANAGATE
jgi:hypothetical protein